MVGIAVPSRPFARGFDCLEPLSLEAAQALRALGFEWAGRYLHNLTPKERDDIFTADLRIAPITMAADPHKRPLTGALGEELGQTAVRLAMALGVPAKVHLWSDLEATDGTDPRDVNAYAAADATVRLRAAYNAGLYVAVGQPLDGQELFDLPHNAYARGAGLAIPEVPCGFCWLQLFPLDQTVAGHRIDYDVIQSDFRGRTPILWAAR